MACQILIRLHPAYGHATHVLLLRMIIRLVAQGDLLLTDLLEQFTVRSLTARRARRNGVVLKNPAHVVEQPGSREEHIGIAVVIDVIQEELGILVSL